MGEKHELAREVRDMMIEAESVDRKYQAHLELAKRVEQVAANHKEGYPEAEWICANLIGPKSHLVYLAKYEVVTTITSMRRRLDEMQGIGWSRPPNDEPPWLDFPKPLQSFLASELERRRLTFSRGLPLQAAGL